MSPHIVAIIVTLLLLLLGAGAFALIVLLLPANELQDAGVELDASQARTAPSFTREFTNRQRVAIITGIPAGELRSPNFAPNDTLFWYGGMEFLITEDGNIRQGLRCG
jgi:hypothetical protein